VNVQYLLLLGKFGVNGDMSLLIAMRKGLDMRNVRKEKKSHLVFIP
jgi:hypothetical protein